MFFQGSALSCGGRNKTDLKSDRFRKILRRSSASPMVESEAWVVYASHEQRRRLVEILFCFVFLNFKWVVLF